MPVSVRLSAVAALVASVACTQQADSSSSGDTSKPQPSTATEDRTDVEPSEPADGWRPAGVTSRREHEGDDPHITRLTQGVYWIDPGVLTALVAEVAGGALKGSAEKDAWRVTNVAPDSVAARLGLQPGDSIRRVAGHSVGDPRMFETVHQLARHAERIDVELQRDGEPTFLRYHVAPMRHPTVISAARAQLAAVLGAGVIAYGPAKRVVDRLVLTTIRDDVPRLSRSEGDVLAEVFGLPEGAKIQSIGKHTVDHPRVAWIALGELADESAFTLTYDVDGRSGLVEVEVTEGILSAEDTKTAYAKLEANDLGIGSRGSGSTTPTIEGIEKTSDTSYTIERKTLEDWLANPTALARSARVVPSIKDGKPNGFKLYAIRPGSVYAALGIRNGDTITSVNGMDVSAPDKALEVYTKMRGADEIVLDVIRRGKPMKLSYSIE